MSMTQKEVKKWTIQYNDKPIAADVPGDVAAILYKKNIINDPFYSDNIEQYAWIQERTWEYNTKILITDKILQNKKVALSFEGIDTFAEVYLNDTLIGKTDNMFRRYTFDIKPYAVEGENSLTVKILPVREMATTEDTEKYEPVFTKERTFVRKAQCHFGWDWGPNFPGTGIYKPVYLCYGDEYHIDNVQVRTDDRGNIGFLVHLAFNNRLPAHSDFDGEVAISVYDPWGTLVEKKERKVLGSIQSLNFRLENPQLWFPLGYGEQPLYTYVAILKKGNEEISKETGRFGVRKIDIVEDIKEDSGATFYIYCNGVRIRCVGGNWIPCSPLTGAITEERRNKLLQIAVDAGFNTMRVWGGGIYEDDKFYDFCDEHGILVWQDFMLSCIIPPDDVFTFRDQMEIEAREQIIRLRNHPCILLWCGGNELADSFKIHDVPFGRYVTKILLAGLVHDLDNDRKYYANSPISITDLGNDVSSGDCHRNVHGACVVKGDMTLFRTFMPANRNAFDSEIAILGMCRLRSLKKFMPKDQLWPQNELWKKRMMANPAIMMGDFTERMTFIAEGLLGPIEGLEDFVKKSMVAHSELLAGEIDFYRADANNSGILNWMYNDCWGTGTWSVVDYYYEKKPAYYAMKRAGKRLKVNITQEVDGYYANVINDTYYTYKGPLFISHETLTGDCLQSMENDVCVAPFSQIRTKLPFDTTVKNAFFYASIQGDYAIFFYDLWKDKRFQTKLGITTRRENGDLYLVIEAYEFARTVFIDVPDGVDVDLEDNYFDLKKGSVRKIKIKAQKYFDEKNIKVLTYADVWED